MTHRVAGEVAGVQVNLFQKPSFLHQLTHNMARDCSLNSPEKYKLKTCCVQVLFWMSKQKNNFCTQHVVNLYFSGNSMNNLSSYCGLTDSRMRTSEKDLPVPKYFLNNHHLIWKILTKVTLLDFLKRFNYNFTQFDIEEVSFFSVLTRDLVVSAACSPSFVDVRKHVASRLVCNVLLVVELVC